KGAHKARRRPGCFTTITKTTPAATAADSIAYAETKRMTPCAMTSTVNTSARAVGRLGQWVPIFIASRCRRHHREHELQVAESDGADLIDFEALFVEKTDHIRRVDVTMAMAVEPREDSSRLLRRTSEFHH